MSESLRVQSAAVRGASSRADSAAATATPGSAQVRPCAPDVVSVAASTRFGSRMALARQYSAAANALAAHYGVKLNATAEAYDRQEEASASLLGGGAEGLSGAAEGAIDALTDMAGLPALSSMLGAAPVSGLSPGEVPSSPRDIARLIESGRGGAGKQAWQAAEARLRHEARQLDDAADQMRAAITTAQAGWQSSSADAATSKLRTLQTWYKGHADYVRGLAGEAETHVQNFTQATATIPSYKDVVAGERELKNAVEANARSKGMHRAAVVHAQVKVSGLYSASTTGFTSYTTAEALPTPTMPTPPPGLTPDQSTDAGTLEAGEGKVNTLKPTPSPHSAPVDPVQAGNGVGQDLSPGSTFPVGALDPSTAANPLTAALPDTAGSLLPEMMPALLGGVVGGLGGTLGGLAGAGQKAVQSLQQAAGPLMNEMGQHQPESGGDKPQDGDKSGGEPSSEPPGGSELAGMPDGGGGADGGGGGGEMEPAGGAEPMAAPPEVAPTPIAAAPAAAAGPAPEPPAAGPGMGMGMMPPMGGLGGGSGQGPDVKDLYRDRKLKMVAPPNSEPVKNRREGRGDRKKEK